MLHSVPAFANLEGYPQVLAYVLLIDCQASLQLYWDCLMARHVASNEVCAILVITNPHAVYAVVCEYRGNFLKVARLFLHAAEIFVRHACPA